MKRPSVQRIREVFDYNPEDGLLRWRVSPNRRIRVGSVAGCKNNGYYKTCLDGAEVMAHRLVWAHYHGVWPEFEIDHINGNRADNRISNLRDVPHMVNSQNIKGPFRNNSIGLLGVVKDHGRYTARIGVNGKTIHVGMYGTPEEAHAAYMGAKRNLHEGNML